MHMLIYIHGMHGLDNVPLNRWNCIKTGANVSYCKLVSFFVVSILIIEFHAANTVHPIDPP